MNPKPKQNRVATVADDLNGTRVDLGELRSAMHKCRIAIDVRFEFDGMFEQVLGTGNNVDELHAQVAKETKK